MIRKPFTVKVDFPGEGAIPVPDMPCNWIGEAKAAMDAFLMEADALRQNCTVTIIQHLICGDVVLKRGSTWFPVVPPPAMGAWVIPVEFKTAA